MTKFEEKKKEAYEKASIKNFGNADGSRAMRYLLNELENAGLLKEKQALPVVPDYVGNAVMKINLEHLFTGYTNGINEKAKNWLERHKGVKSLGYYVCQLRFQGFTVEKPQLFYLKHIDMSKLDETHDWFILHHGSLGHSPFCKGELPYYCNNAKFTQAEIDSMQTGSYEQIEVAE